VITIDNLPDFPFQDNSNVSKYEPALDILAPRESHSTGLLFCALGPILKIQNSDAIKIESLDNTEACLANPFPPTNPPIREDQLTKEDFEGLQLDLVGLSELLDKGAFEILTELFIENFFNSVSSMGVTQVESDVTVTDVLTPDDRRRLETDRITVVFDMTLTYVATEGTVERSELAAAAFTGDEQRDKVVQALLDSEEESFANIESISELEVPEGTTSMAYGTSIAFTSLLCFTWAMLLQ
jgi:hypothetical protein